MAGTKQNLLSYNCPVVYGKSSYPLIILTILYFCCLIFSMFQAIGVINSRNHKKNSKKMFFLTSLSLFFTIKCISLAVPIPHNMFSYSFVCYQFPRYMLLISWEFMVLWLGPTSLFTNKSKSIRSKVIPVIFLIIDFLLLISIIITSCYVSV